jgi:hypothetical protein
MNHRASAALTDSKSVALAGSLSSGPSQPFDIIGDRGRNAPGQQTVGEVHCVVRRPTARCIQIGQERQDAAQTILEFRFWLALRAHFRVKALRSRRILSRSD